MSAGTPAPAAVAAVDLTASTVLVSGGGKPAAASPRAAAAKAPAAGGSTRKSFDSNSSGQSWELVGAGEASAVSPASA